ncbi:hypothetical protein CEXT_758781 [Caerostris extrusa]|uniref:Uncharacterized protein n=1 Tax=Caerostris extrusa TaxID=172846 RepID=A0AAV4U5H1_CAEEX|nr:hypothetical protein CEXT_758781 [Caerostris extrusa]
MLTLSNLDMLMHITFLHWLDATFQCKLHGRRISRQCPTDLTDCQFTAHDCRENKFFLIVAMQSIGHYRDSQTEDTCKLLSNLKRSKVICPS